MNSTVLYRPLRAALIATFFFGLSSKALAQEHTAKLHRHHQQLHEHKQVKKADPVVTEVETIKNLLSNFVAYRRGKKIEGTLEDLHKKIMRHVHNLILHIHGKDPKKGLSPQEAEKLHAHLMHMLKGLHQH